MHYKVCTTLFAAPPSLQAVKPLIVSLTDLTITVEFSQFLLEDTRVSQYYSYIVQLIKASSGSIVTEATVQHTIDTERIQVKIQVPEYNTEYTGRVIPSREIKTDEFKNEKSENGTESDTFTFKAGQ